MMSTEYCGTESSTTKKLCQGQWITSNKLHHRVTDITYDLQFDRLVAERSISSSMECEIFTNHGRNSPLIGLPKIELQKQYSTIEAGSMALEVMIVSKVSISIHFIA